MAPGVALRSRPPWPWSVRAASLASADRRCPAAQHGAAALPELQPPSGGVPGLLPCLCPAAGPAGGSWETLGGGWELALRPGSRLSLLASVCCWARHLVLLPAFSSASLGPVFRPPSSRPRFPPGPPAQGRVDGGCLSSCGTVPANSLFFLLVSSGPAPGSERSPEKVRNVSDLRG